MKVLLVEDDASLREGMGELIAEQAEVRDASSVAQALAALREELFCLVVTDLRIGETGEGGRIILEAARQRLQPVAIVSAATSEEVVKVLRPHEPDAVLAKPFQIDDILALVERFVGLGTQVEQAAKRGPPAGTWTEVAAGFQVLEESGGCVWARMAPGASYSRPALRGRSGVMVVEGSLEVEGERRVGHQYFYLAAGPREVRTHEGCLAVSMALRG
ncbi:response regulator [Archangium lansingense]|uniref:Response regulator n=1 Tax=Archangium lansingense TaxID=2995310 RepID=A0ABT4AAS5_9BACT|nr:response regulator [Archangium lansinium]MCY1078334.1 response regulator [Archangium lansinium]